MNASLRQVRTLFSIGCIADRPDGELLEWFTVHRTEAELAFEELMNRHGPMVLDVCRRILRDPHDVEDAFQATFLILLRRAGSIRNRDALGGWLHRVALRVALRARAESARRCALERQAVRPGTSGAELEDAERSDARAALHEELDRMPASHRAVLVACYLEGRTHEEAASLLRWPIGTVRSRLARGRDRLRERLARRGLSPDMASPTLQGLPQAVPAVLRTTTARSMCFYLAGASGAGNVPAPVVNLAERVIRAMNLKSLSIVATVALTVSAIVGTLPFLTTWTPRPARASADPSPRAPQEPSEALSGVVRDSEGHPLEGATVVAGAFGNSPNHQVATTDADGHFAFETKEGEKKPTYVMAYKKGLAPASKFHGLSSDDTSANVVELTLLPTEPFVGAIRARDGTPISGATVRIRYMRGRGGKYDHNPILENVLKGTPLESLFQTKSDQDGRFRFHVVPTPQRVVLHASADGMADFTTEVPGDYEAGYISGSESAPAQLTMEREARVVGRVVTRLPDLSVGGLKIGMQSTHDSPQFWRSVTTDNSGRFVLHGLPDGGANIFLTDHPNDGPWTYRAIDNLGLHPGKTAEVTIELINGVVVEGKVLDAETDDPVEGVPIGMYGPARPDSGAAILLATTDTAGGYRFRLPPGKTRFYVASYDWEGSGQLVEIPADVETFSLPSIKVKRSERQEVTKSTKVSAAAESPSTETWNLSGVVLDVSDEPVAGATLVGALVDQDKRLDRQIVTTGPDGRFALTLKQTNPKNPETLARIYAFKDGLAPAGISKTEPDEDLVLVLTRTRPFVGAVQDHDEQPIAGAEVRVQSIKGPVPDGQGLMVTDISWPTIEGTPLEDALRTTSNDAGTFRLPSMPGRSQLSLTVTAKGKRTHHTSDFTLPGMTGRWPTGFDDGFLHGSVDGPATLYLDEAELPFGKSKPSKTTNLD